MPKYKVTLGALRFEWNTKEIGADTPELACAKAIETDDGGYEPGDLGPSFVQYIDDADGELPVPEAFNEKALTGITYVPPTTDPWAERPGFPLADWRHEVANDDTRLGYAAWCDAKAEADAMAARIDGMEEYRVTLHEDKGDKHTIVFDCHADAADHAAEQALNAYPNGEVLNTTIKRLIEA